MNVRFCLAKTKDRALMELALLLVSALQASPESIARQVIVVTVAFLVETLLSFQTSTNVRYCLAKTEEHALMELMNSRVSALRASQETNARRVRVFPIGLV